MHDDALNRRSVHSFSDPNWTGSGSPPALFEINDTVSIRWFFRHGHLIFLHTQPAIWSNSFVLENANRSHIANHTAKPMDAVDESHARDAILLLDMDIRFS